MEAFLIAFGVIAIAFTVYMRALDARVETLEKRIKDQY